MKYGELVWPFPTKVDAILLHSTENVHGAGLKRYELI
jgi:hypothetical protein